MLRHRRRANSLANQKENEWKPDNDPKSGSIEAPGSEIIVEPEKVPEGWMTVRQISQAAGYSETWTYKKVLKLVEAGKAEERQFRINTGQHVMSVTHYHITCDI